MKMFLVETLLNLVIYVSKHVHSKNTASLDMGEDFERGQNAQWSVIL